MKVAAGIRDALLADATLVALLGDYVGRAAIHTRRPVPSESGKPYVLVGPNAAAGDENAIDTERPVVTVDVAVYGDKRERVGQPDDYHDVETAAERIRKMFRPQNKSILSVTGFHVVGISASGPIPAPVDDESQVGRVVTIEVRLVET